METGNACSVLLYQSRVRRSAACSTDSRTVAPSACTGRVIVVTESRGLSAKLKPVSKLPASTPSTVTANTVGTECSQSVTTSTSICSNTDASGKPSSIH